MLQTLERMLELPAENLTVALMHATDLIAAALDADKVDAFLYEAAKDRLVAIGSSAQPLSELQRQHGLDVLPVANGGRVVWVYKSGQNFLTGHLETDDEELRGIKETLKIRSKVGVPLRVGGEIRGMVMVASLAPEFFDEEDLRFLASMVHWVGLIAQRAELVETIARNASESGRRAGAEELITLVAHELRNHIAPLDLRLHALARRAAGEERMKDVEDIDKARKNLTRVLSLVSEILDVARIDQGLFHVDTRPIDLVALCSEVADVLTTPHHVVDVRAARPLPVVADAARLRQCVENLISNAIKHSPPDAPITVAVAREPAREGTWARIEVIDDGPGVAAEALPRIFDRFATDRSQGGLGLGLSLAKRIAELHGGGLEAERAPGRGARFVLRLPMADHAPSADLVEASLNEDGAERKH
jgi:two-component system, OmpR family, sensor kinase